jgi:ketosteroid isomerase-like protein
VVRGREAIKAMWSGAIRDLALRDVALNTLDLEVGADIACEVGEARLTLEPASSAPTTARMKYVVVWKKAAGRWQLHRDIWNAQA